MRTTGFTIGMLVAATVMTASITACEDSSNAAKGDAVVTPSEQTQSVGKANPVQAQVTGVTNVYVKTSQKKLVQMTKTENNGEQKTYTLTYGNDGHVLSITETDGRTSEVKTMAWGNDALMEIEGNTSSTTLAVENGLLRSAVEQDAESSLLSYNQAGQLMKLQKFERDGTEDERKELTWEGGLPVRTTDYDNGVLEETTEIAYGTQTCTAYMPLMVEEFIDNTFESLLAHPELAGMRLNALPTTITKAEGAEVTTEKYAYTTDAEGYVTACTVTETETTGGKVTESEAIAYTFTWQ